MGGDQKYRVTQILKLFYYSIFPKISFARSFSALSSIIPESFTQIDPPILEIIGNKQQDSPSPSWTHTWAFGSHKIHGSLIYFEIHLVASLISAIFIRPLLLPYSPFRCTTIGRWITPLTARSRDTAPLGRRCSQATALGSAMYSLEGLWECEFIMLRQDTTTYYMPTFRTQGRSFLPIPEWQLC